MGAGTVLNCQDCGYQCNVRTGVGKRYSMTYREEIQAMKAGKYGKTRADFLAAHPDAVIDVAYKVVICPECGAFENVMDLSIYVPREGKNKDGYWVDEDGLIIPEWDFQAHCNKMMDYPRKCLDCHHTMVDCADEVALAMQGQLKCPKCHGKMEVNGMMMWD